ncbi:MAG: signal peptidase II [Solirubrobacteraceae bacterium]
MSPSSPAGRRASSGTALDRSLRAWLLALATAVVVVLVDQASKAAVRGSIVPGEARSVLPGLQFVNTRNRGIAFGFLPGQHWAITVLIAVALLILLVYFARHSTLALIWLPTGMLIGGALGNVFDRVRAGYVTDFVKLPLGWPPFNLADAAITIGVLLLVLVIERRGVVETQSRSAERSP